MMKRAAVTVTRPEETISKEQQKLWDKVWWNRHMALGEPGQGATRREPWKTNTGRNG
jgi:hypothetical protein